MVDGQLLPVLQAVDDSGNYWGKLGWGRPHHLFKGLSPALFLQMCAEVIKDSKSTAGD